MFVLVHGVTDVLAVESGEVSLGTIGKEFLTGLSLRSFTSTLRWICSQGSEPREHSEEYVCMLRQVCPGVSKSTEDIQVCQDIQVWSDGEGVTC